MSTAVEILAVGGIQRAADVVAIAARCGLELAAAATVLVMESGGGANVWGHDDVATGGIYTKGAPVTQAAYLLYRAAVARGEIGRQGVGPCQLTYGPLQDAADKIGGCWDWTANATVGFGHLAALLQRLGPAQGFAAYNGSGPAAQHYGAVAAAHLDTWRAALAAAQEDDMALTDEDVQKVAKAVLDALIPDYAKDPTGKTSIPLGISEAWEATHVGQLIAKVDALSAHLGVTP
jgi:hypothetical protein